MIEHIDRNEYFGTIVYDIKKNDIKITPCEKCLTDIKNQNSNYLSAPINVFLELTNKCGLNCRHCFNEKIRNEKLLSIGTWKRIIDELVDMKVFFVKITGGEPFLYPQLFELLHYLDLKQLNYIIYTNGLNITNNIEEIKNLKHLLMLRVSLEGTEAYNDYIRGKGNFNKVISVFKILESNGINYSINYTINRKNYTVLPDLEKYIIDICKLNTTIHLGFIKYAGSSLKNTELCFKDDECYRKALDFIDGFLKTSRIVEPLYMLPEYYYTVCGNHFGCPAGQLSMVIRYNGDVIPCGLMDGYEIARCGNACTDKLINIWNSERMNYFRCLKCSERCEECVEFMRNCTGGCRANALNLFENITCNDVNCYIYTTNFARKNRVI